jgi:predicted PurR-regulated permease PerM
MITIGFSTRKDNQKYIDYLKKTCNLKNVEVIQKVNNGEKSLSKVYNEILASTKRVELEANNIIYILLPVVLQLLIILHSFFYIFLGSKKLKNENRRILRNDLMFTAP